MADMRSNRSAKKDSSIVLKGFFYLFIFFSFTFYCIFIAMRLAAWLPTVHVLLYECNHVVSRQKGKRAIHFGI